jgi:cold-inducible RNA-binding protein
LGSVGEFSLVLKQSRFSFFRDKSGPSQLVRSFLAFVNSSCLFASPSLLIRKKMSTKLYVGNLSFRVTSDDLFEHFSSAGAVESANVVFDRDTGRSRGFGFVEMASEDEANSANEQFNGEEYDGRSMVVNAARPREEAGGGNNRGGGFRGGNNRGGSGSYNGGGRSGGNNRGGGRW